MDLKRSAEASGLEGDEAEVAHPFMAAGRGKPCATTYWLRFDGAEGVRRTALL